MKREKIEFSENVKIDHKLVIERFDEFVYVERDGEEFVLLRDFFDAHQKDKRHRWLWRTDLLAHTYYAFAADFLKDYYFKGYRYTYPHDRDYVVNPLPLLRQGKAKGRFFQDHLGDDGFLYFRGSPVLRPIPLELWESYYHLQPLLSFLAKQKKVSDVEIAETPYFNVEICGRRMVNCLYTPTKQEFKKMQQHGEFWSCHCNDRAIENMRLERFRKEERDNADQG